MFRLLCIAPAELLCYMYQTLFHCVTRTLSHCVIWSYHMLGLTSSTQQAIISLPNALFPRSTQLLERLNGASHWNLFAKIGWDGAGRRNS